MASPTVSAYILIQTDMDKATNVAETIRQIDGIVFADIVTGPYDIIAKADADSMDNLGRMVVQKVQMSSGVNRTLTCPVVNI